jgi:single-strand DNA-binding protein
MAGETQITIIGNLTADVELRFTPTGKAVASFTVASTPRILDRNTNEWKDGDALFMRCSIWDKPAENAAESFRKGDRVIAVGRLQQRSFETREGDKRTVVEMQVDELAASTKWRTILHGERVARQQQAEDPWANQTPASGSEEPPF